MIVRAQDRSRVPGPIGTSTSGGGERVPGPLGIVPTVFMAPAPTVAVSRTFDMPAPAISTTNKTLHAYPEPLFQNKTPITSDVKQGELATCPIASILAALANTPSGRTRIRAVVKEHPGAVLTNVPPAVAKKLHARPAGNAISTNRYFTVQVGGGKSIEVSDVLYSDDADSGWGPIYMKLPNDALWPCVIEKAFAVREKSYEDLDAKDSATAFWLDLVGSQPKVVTLSATTALSAIRAIAAAAGKVPAIAASKDNASDLSDGLVDDFHGYAIIGVKKDPKQKAEVVELYNPWGKTANLTLEQMRSFYKAILHG